MAKNVQKPSRPGVKTGGAFIGEYTVGVIANFRLQNCTSLRQTPISRQYLSVVSGLVCNVCKGSDHNLTMFFQLKLVKIALTPSPLRYLN